MTLPKPLATVRKYSLKPMVIARVFAELTVLVLLVCLPLLLWGTGRLAPLPMAGKAVIFTLSGLALLVMPWFGFITYQVTSSQAGLLALSLFKKQSCQWQQIRGLSRRCTNNILRYVVELEDKSEFTFPVLLKNCEALVDEIKQHLPKGSHNGGMRNPYRLFRTDPLAMGVQFAQAFACLFFILVIWIFCTNTLRTTHNSDAYVVLAFSIICSAALGWRCFVVALMAKTVELTRDAIVVSTLFFQKTYPWNEVKSVKMPFPLLPEGFILKTKKFSYLISTGMDAGDELQDAIQGRLEQAKGAV